MKQEKDFCPNCETERPVRCETVRESYEIRGESVESDHERLVCAVCGEDFVTGDMMDRNLEGARAAYRARHGILSPKEIVELRHRYGASQKAFALILGFGELTINSYEQGSLPTEANNNLLKLMRNPEDFRKLFYDKKDSIGPTQRRRIEERLNALGSQKTSIRISYDTAEKLEECEAHEAVQHGYAARSIEKLWTMFQLIIAYGGSPQYKMQILKKAFYADFSNFRRCTVSITGWQYAAIPYGPVPNDYMDILAAGEKNGYFFSHPDEDERGEIYELPEEFSLKTAESHFSSDERNSIKAVSEQLRGKTAAELSALTHLEKAWTETPHAECISYEWAMQLTGIKPF